MKVLLLCLILPALCFADCIWLKKANSDTCLSMNLLTNSCQMCDSGYTPIRDGCFSSCAQGTTGCTCISDAANSSTPYAYAEMAHGHFWLYLFSAIGVLAIIFGAAYLVKTYVMKNQVKAPVQSSAVEISSKYVNLSA